MNHWKDSQEIQSGISMFGMKSGWKEPVIGQLNTQVIFSSILNYLQIKNQGWAAIDATPQESSNGLMQCGPAPLAAIKQGHIYIGYDTGFVFAEVNADRVEWIVKQEGSYNYIKGPVPDQSVNLRLFRALRDLNKGFINRYKALAVIKQEQLASIFQRNQ